MAKSVGGFHESRTRISLSLPAGEPCEKKAVWAVVRYLEEERKRRSASVEGFTRSEIDDTVFFGYWYDKGWVREPAVVFVIDYHRSNDQQQFEQALGLLVKAIKQEYRKKCRRSQKIVWMIAQSATRFV